MSSNPPNLARLQRAAGLLQSGDVVGALVEIDAVLAASASDVEALHLKAMALGRAGRIDDAAVVFEKAARLHPRKDIVLINYGNLLKRAGRIEAAADVYARATKAAPNSADAFNALGLALRQIGDTSAARNAFETALNINPQHPQALNNAGLVEAKANRHAEAIEYFSRALKAQPQSVAALINRGSAYRVLGRLDLAHSDQKTAAALAPKVAEPVYQIAATLRQAGDFNGARSAYRHALDLEPLRADIHREYANFLFEIGEPQARFDLIDRAIQRTGSPDLAATKADLAQLTGEPMIAISAAGEAISRNPECASAYEVRARARRATGDIAAALGDARKAAILDSSNFDFIHTCAEIELATGAVDDAIARLQGEAPATHLQKHIALKSVAMRLKGDPAYRNYYDFDRFTAQIEIPPPAGYQSIDAFNEALAASIQRLHRSSQRPVDQTLYGGTQSPGRLWNEPDPVIQAYVSAMLEAALQFVRLLPDDPAHPFLRRKSEDLRCAGAWSVILQSGGGHVDHIHPAGWISACYYVSAPAEIFAGDRAGYLRLGAAGIAGIDLPAERYFAPRPGTVVFFPSYVWHGVEPFAAIEPRITAPFDLAPGAA